MLSSPVKVLLVDDSAIALEILQRLLKTSPDIEVVATASNGNEALNLIPQVKPQVICTDLHMTGMNGLELTQQVMAKYPTPIMVISNWVREDDRNNIFKLLQAGAIDVFPKPVSGEDSDYQKIKDRLIAKIRVLSGVSVFTRGVKRATGIAANRSAIANSQADTQIPFKFAIKVVTIGSSTGGPKALHQILAALPSNFPLPIICTQHISPGFLEGLVSWLNTQTQLKIKIADLGETPLPGTVYFAPDRYHLGVNDRGKFNYITSDSGESHCPSVTVMFQSVANFYGRGTLGILLTGMGKDGAKGMEAIALKGGLTIAQDEKSSVIFGMPKAAVDLGVVKHVLSLPEITDFLQNIRN